MGCPPSAYPLHILRTSEVVPVLRLAQPTALTGRLAGLAAGPLRTVVVVTEVAWIGTEKIAAVSTLTLSVLFHWCASWSTPMMGNSPFFDRRRWLQTAFRKKTEDEKKGLK
jgi:hypothetical protein